MNDMVVRTERSIAAFAMPEAELLEALESSLYPGAKLTSVKLVVNVCRAQHLDPFQKPFHIVPMSVKKAGTQSDYDWRDVIMPGIGLYRVQAVRTGEYAGIDEGVFGEDMTEKLATTDMTYPQWCSVTVYRIVQGQRVGFSSGRVYWKETYATAKRDTDAPNAMWRKRPRGQIEKCAEALALRRAFPELGSQPTAEEMEGKVIDSEGEVIERQPPQQPKSKSEASTIDHETGEVIDHKPEPKNGHAAPVGMVKIIRAKAAAINVSEERLLECHKLTTLDGISVDVGNAILKSLASGAEAYAK
jgi:phage recombination protein Bet